MIIENHELHTLKKEEYDFKKSIQNKPIVEKIKIVNDFTNEIIEISDEDSDEIGEVNEKSEEISEYESEKDSEENSIDNENSEEITEYENEENFTFKENNEVLNNNFTTYFNNDIDYSFIDSTLENTFSNEYFDLNFFY